MATIAERIKELRKENGYNQSELANALNVADGTITMWETGRRKPKYDVIYKMSEIFDRRIEYILGYSDEPLPLGLTEEEKDAVAWIDSPEDEATWLAKQESKELAKIYCQLDSYGQTAVKALIMNEHKRCQEQGLIEI